MINKNKKKLRGFKRRKFTMFRPKIKSRHPTHQPLRTELPLLPFRSIVRLGSTTESVGRIECNSVEGVKNSANKLLMKQCFTNSGVKTSDWWKYEIAGNIFIKNGVGDRGRSISDLPFPIVCKSLYGSRGIGNTLIKSKEELEKWMIGKNMDNYIQEAFCKYFREYRLHVTSEGCFYALRKLLRNDAPEGTWQLHDDVVTWALDTNPSFKKPLNWGLIVEDCVKALKSLNLDIAAFDVMVQGSKDGVERQNPKWNICESCSAASFGDITAQKYIEQIPKVLKLKYEKQLNN